MQLFALFVCVCLFEGNEASASATLRSGELQLKRAELKASMTYQRAFHIMESSKRTSHELLALLQDNLGNGKMHHHSLHKKLRKHASSLDVQTGPPGAQGNSQSVYGGGVWSALYKINDMLLETVEKADLEEIRCDSYKRTSEVLMEEIKEDLATYIVLVTSAQSDKNEANSNIETHKDEADKIEGEIIAFTNQMNTELTSLNTQLTIAKGDSDVMEKILNMTECNDATVGSATLVQTQADMLQCVDTRTGKSFTKLHIKSADMKKKFASMKHPKILALLRQEGITVDEVDTGSSSALVQKSRGGFCSCSCHDDAELEVVYGSDEKNNTCNIREPFSFSFLDNCCVKAGSVAKVCCDSPTLNPEQEQFGNTVETRDWVDESMKAEKCSLKDSNKCPELRERFLNIAGGIDDTVTQLTHLIASTESRKEHGLKIMRAELAYHKEVGDSETEKLGRAMAILATVQEQQRLKTALLKKTEEEYEAEVTKCKTTLEELANEECALDKIRGELLNMDALPNNVTDCLTSKWFPEECSVTCGGGVQTLTRTVEIETDLGYKCPALKAEQSCNEPRCPLDCELADWTGWSACSAYCDGGIMDRIRPIMQHPTAGGAPCEVTDDSQDCNTQSCDKDCVLHDWTEWSASCTKVCGGGRQTRFKHIKEHEYGEMGTCPTFHDPKRFQWKLCNTHDCQWDDHYPLKCEAKIDVIIAMDDSGSMGDAGWTAAKTAAGNLVASMGGGIRAGALAFSSPSSYYELRWCMGWSTPWWWSPFFKPTHSNCGVKWISHMKDDVGAVEDSIKAQSADFRGTLTNIAIDQAKVELGNHGRDYAQSVLIVFTDGYPESKDRTLESSKAFQQLGRILYVPIGNFGTDDYFQQVASYPWQDNLLGVENFESLAARQTLDRLIPLFCPNVVQNIPTGTDLAACSNIQGTYTASAGASPVRIIQHEGACEGYAVGAWGFTVHAEMAIINNGVTGTISGNTIAWSNGITYTKQ